MPFDLRLLACNGAQGHEDGKDYSAAPLVKNSEVAPSVCNGVAWIDHQSESKMICRCRFVRHYDCDIIVVVVVVGRSRSRKGEFDRVR